LLEPQNEKVHMRSENRGAADLRSITVAYDVQRQAHGSVLITMGNTQVICGASVEEEVPPFLKGAGQGWITAEYGMLPCATNIRYRRETKGLSGRTMEIQRLIGRSLRMMIDLHCLDGFTLRVDCDVLNADGGTRTASITGGALAVSRALRRLVAEGRLSALPVIVPVAAISAGIVDGMPLLDLDYAEDSRAEVDGNFVMTGAGHWIEMGATAEGKPFSDENLRQLTALARRGIDRLFTELWDGQARG
jgi:ribonuclease PH